ncbi:homeodomain transcription factor ste12 [Yamadazyma tenuis]|nr:homeodomain transcription factor ste12 [Yamadazyma tenuis]
MAETSSTSASDLQSKIKKAIQSDEVKESLRLIEDLKFFLATAPANWQQNQVIRRYYLNPDEGFVSCIFWNNLYYITGTDIVRCIVYKFQQFGRKIIDRKKFEEGIFSDLRNLKTGTDAILEHPKSAFLDFLYKNNCLRTQKKQKVFFWFSVAHDKLMADALERDLRKEHAGQVPTTIADREPALSFEYSDEKILYNHLLDYKSQNKEDTTTDDSKDATLSSNETHDEEEREKRAEAEGFILLPQDTPDHYKDQSDDDDEFPLDYVQESNEYILVDSSSNYVNWPNYHEGNVDFVSHLPMISPANQVVLNDEYLIEQTLPMKTPVPLPRSSRPEDFFPFPPLSAKLQQSFAPPPPSSGDQPHFIHLYQPQQDPYHEQEFWPNHEHQAYAPSSGYMIIPDEPASYHTNLMVSYPPHPGTILSQAVPAMAVSSPLPGQSPAYGHFPQHSYSQHSFPQHHTHSPYAIHFPVPSARQQNISANMMMKKRQMLSKAPPGMVTKPFASPQSVMKKPPTERVKKNVIFDDVETPDKGV